ncbi:uncharacterized protein METZ01_LOCUS467035, partial [marine metagenome]
VLVVVLGACYWVGQRPGIEGSRASQLCCRLPIRFVTVKIIGRVDMPRDLPIDFIGNWGLVLLLKSIPLVECFPPIISHMLLIVRPTISFYNLWFVRPATGIGNGREVWLNLPS